MRYPDSDSESLGSVSERVPVLVLSGWAQAGLLDVKLPILMGFALDD